MLKLGPISTAALKPTPTPTPKSKIFLINEGGIRNSVFSNEILKTADFQNILNNLEFTRTEFHHIISTHVNKLFPIDYNSETRTKFPLYASKFLAQYQEQVLYNFILLVKEKLISPV